MNLLKIVFIISLLNLSLFVFLGLSPKTTPVLIASNTIALATPSTIKVTPLPTKNNQITGVQPTLPPPTPDNRCIVTIDGQRYDMTQFRNVHSGGDIFQCGTDMTSIFYQQHNQSYLLRLQNYKI